MNMLYKIKMWNMKRKVIKFLNNVKQNEKSFNYKISGSYFHLYILGKTINLVRLDRNDLDDIINMVCVELPRVNKPIKKEFFKGI